jgi:hypothetical protein
VKASVVGDVNQTQKPSAFAEAKEKDNANKKVAEIFKEI